MLLLLLLLVLWLAEENHQERPLGLLAACCLLSSGAPVAREAPGWALDLSWGPSTDPFLHSLPALLPMGPSTVGHPLVATL